MCIWKKTKTCYIVVSTQYPIIICMFFVLDKIALCRSSRYFIKYI